MTRKVVNDNVFICVCVSVFQEGPHSTLPEDEFFDAVETGLDKIEEDMQLRAKLKLQSQNSMHNSMHLAKPDDEEGNAAEEFGTGALAKSHNLWPEVKEKWTGGF